MGSLSQQYPLPAGVHTIPEHLLDLRSDSEIDHDLLHPRPVIDEKNIWLFWHSGYSTMHAYTKRNVRAWHRRFSKAGWAVRVIDCHASSPLNIANYIDINDPNYFPRAFAEGTITGTYAKQHTSDLVRLPLLLKYGGIYADVGLIQIGDVDWLWRETVGNPDSRFEVLSYNCGDVNERSLANYFLMARPNNPLFERSHRLLLKLWEGKTCTEGMHRSPLLKDLPFLEGSGGLTEQQCRELTDYIIQGQVITLVMGLVDEEDNWDGPKYIAEHLYGIEFMQGSQLINAMTAWNGQKAFELMSLSLPKEGEEESPEQKQAREIVEACLSKSFGFKLAHGYILEVMSATLGSLWRANEGSDNVPGTYAHWLRHGIVYWSQDVLPVTQAYMVKEPVKVGGLLKE
ncbi:capsule polysaccharide biosynthesis protein [Aspergillus sclerotiicarbonarius CBS 121057]|uniref:Capsule polysaccharide biosynthesis protein n=1 Tax=Aspergillus sclerotiicarbonarius (strain CBS 121057 / IBT 28362) TaxID=1448318 RepID=A0A319ED31_ASPSB|nr:capsule polysaccharide biosynthesis protein [Aspergillus sclerotiicarbonarius CBS 121057]